MEVFLRATIRVTLDAAHESAENVRRDWCVPSAGFVLKWRRDSLIQKTSVSSHWRITGTERCQGGRGEGRAHETSHVPYVPPFVCHAPARKRLWHSNHSGLVGASRHQNNDDLHACAQPRARGCSQSAGRIV